MSFLAVAGVFLKLPRLFLKRCKWVLVRMTLHCKLSTCKSSRIPANSNVAKVVRKEQLQGSSGDGLKWRRAFMVLSVFVCLIGSLWLFPNLNHNGGSMKKEKVSTLWVEKARILQERLNVTRSQLHAMATLFDEYDQIKPSECIERMRLEMPLGDDFNCALEALSLYREKFQMWHEWVEEKIEARDQCPVRDEYIPKKPVSTLVKERHAPPGLSEASLSNNQIKNDLQTRYLGDYRKEYCESLPICFLKISWCVFIGMMVGWKFSCFNEGLRIIPKQKQAQQELIQKQPQAQSSSKGCGKWRRKLLVVFLLAGIIGSSWLFRFMNKNTILWRREMLANMCDERARMLQDQFNVSLNHVHALAILVSTFHHGKKPTAIDQKTFAEYTERTAFERPLTSGVGYALKVMHSEREQFEKLHGWTIKKMETDDHSSIEDYIPEKLDPSPVEDEYAPVIFSQETVSHIVSIDMMSGKEDRENILRARKCGKGVLTSPFKLLKSNHLGVVLTFAIYNTDLPQNATPEQRIEATEGYLGASYDVPSLVEKLLHQLASKQTIVVNVYDTTNSSAPISMYGPNVTDTGLLHISNLDFGDPVRRHEMHCRFKQKAPPPLTAIMASLGVLVITLLVGHIFDAAINRIAKVEGDYCEMMELKVRAEAADVAKSQFLATVSHEIRTPMNGVLGMLQMLMDTDLNANQLDYATTALESGKDLISLINEVLDQARIESGRLELEAVPFDLRSVLDNVLSLFSGKSQDKHIELAVYISDLVPEVVIGDPGRFRQIITNLVGNSVKFTEEGHVLVSVHIADEVRTPLEVKDKMLKQPIELANDGEVKSYDTLSGLPVVNRWKSWEKFETLKNGSSMDATEMINLLVTVEDTGVGIPTDAQSRIFMPFMQADSSTSRTYGGTGIGLSISKCLVDMMGGEIGFVSERGTGSVFSFTVGLAKGRIDSLDKKKRHQFEQSMSELKGLKALIVDVRSVRAAVTLYHLNRLGISVDIATSLEAMCSHVSNACKTSGKMPFDMVLIDKDGWNKEISPALHCILKELRLSGNEKLSKTHLKIFLLATSSSTETAEFSSSGLVDEVIMKPLRLGMLVKCFQQAFGSGKHHHKERPSFLQSLLSGKEILVVDDNVVNRRVAAGALKKYGAKVTCVESGKAALAKLRPPHNFDACFMDLQMPEMDGFEATRQVRCIENDINKQTETSEACSENLRYVKHWHTPILAMTADVIQATHEKCMKCGMDGYVSKPFEEEQLYNAVMHFFESEQSSPSHET